MPLRETWNYQIIPILCNLGVKLTIVAKPQYSLLRHYVLKLLTLSRTKPAIQFLKRSYQNSHSLQVWSLSVTLPSFAISLKFHLRFLLSSLILRNRTHFFKILRQTLSVMNTLLFVIDNQPSSMLRKVDSHEHFRCFTLNFVHLS